MRYAPYLSGLKGGSFQSFVLPDGDFAPGGGASTRKGGGASARSAPAERFRLTAAQRTQLDKIALCQMVERQRRTLELAVRPPRRRELPGTFRSACSCAQCAREGSLVGEVHGGAGSTTSPPGPALKAGLRIKSVEEEGEGTATASGKGTYSIDYGPGPGEPQIDVCPQPTGALRRMNCASYSSGGCGYPDDYEPCTPRGLALTYLWGELFAYGGDPGLEEATLDRLLGEFVIGGPESTTGSYFSEMETTILRYALQLIDRFIDLVPNSTRCCTGAQDYLREQLYSGGFTIFSSGAWFCRTDIPAFQTTQCGDTPLITSFDFQGTRAYHDPVISEIHFCYSYLHGLARIADEYMNEAANLFCYLADGLVASVTSPSGAAGLTEEEVQYLGCARRLAKISMGAVSTVARTLIHEMMHQKEWGSSHCSKRCCMQRIALTWQCRVTAKAGLYVADDSGVDWAGASSANAGVIEYTSFCRDGFGRDRSRFRNAFNGICRMDDPGQTGDESAFSEDGDQELNSGTTVECTDAQGRRDFCEPLGCNECG